LYKKFIKKVDKYEAGKPIEDVAREYGLEPDSILKLASNENPLGTSPKVVEALKNAVEEVFLYPDAACYELKHKISEKYGIPVEELVIGNGSDHIIRMIAIATLGPGDTAVTSQATFVRYKHATLLTGAEILEVPHKNWHYDLEAVANAIDETTRLIWLACPNNPTGTIFSSNEFEKFMSKVPSHVWVVLDQAYYEFAINDPEADFPDGMAYYKSRGYPNLIVMRTMAKAYGIAGLRVGWMAAPAWFVDIVERIRGPFDVSRLAQVAAVAALEDDEFVEKTVELVLNEKKWLYRKLDELGIHYIKSYTNFIFMRTGFDGRKLFEAMQRRGVIVRPIFADWVRVTVGRREDNERFVKVFEEVRKELEKENKTLHSEGAWV